MTARTSRLLPALTLAALAIAAGIPQQASAQMVPRLVSYPRPATSVAACSVDPQTSLANRRSIAYARGSWNETIEIFKAPNCAPESKLFTVRTGGGYQAGGTLASAAAYRTVTPSPSGAAFLQQQCGQYAWSAGVPQNVSAASCGVVASL
jgi:hypothetical protein